MGTDTVLVLYRTLFSKCAPPPQINLPRGQRASHQDGETHTLIPETVLVQYSDGQLRLRGASMRTTGITSGPYPLLAAENLALATSDNHSSSSSSRDTRSRARSTCRHQRSQAPRTKARAPLTPASVGLGKTVQPGARQGSCIALRSLWGGAGEAPIFSDITSALPLRIAIDSEAGSRC